MSAYRRFVAYVYEYHKEQKKENRGFIKVEVRNDECTMDIHLQCPNLAPAQTCSIYGFVRKKQDLIGIPLGVCSTGQGKIEHQLRTNANNLQGQPVRLEDLGGMVLLLEGGGFYGTQWDDSPISPLAFQMPKEPVKPEEKFSKKEALPADPSRETEKNTDSVIEESIDNSMDSLPEPPTVEPLKNSQEENANIAIDTPEKKEIPPQTEDLLLEDTTPAFQKEAEIPLETEPTKSQNAPPLPTFVDEETRDFKEPSPSTDNIPIQPEEPTASTIAEEEACAGEAPPAIPKPEETQMDNTELEDSDCEETPPAFQENIAPSLQSQQAEICAHETTQAAEQEKIIVPIPESFGKTKVPIKEPEAWEEEPEEQAIHTTEALLKEVLPEKKKQKSEEFWPFEDGEIIDCQRIYRRDLERLHRRDWGLKNNRFLLYSYQYFGFLLLGKLRGTDQYVLGVPGVYDQQERFMARTFGFPHFKTSRTLDPSLKKGGYWYRLIEPPTFPKEKRQF